MLPLTPLSFFFFFNDTATTEIYTLSLHDALPIYVSLTDVFEAFVIGGVAPKDDVASVFRDAVSVEAPTVLVARSEEHTSELQSRSDLVCRLLLEKKKKRSNIAR